MQTYAARLQAAIEEADYDFVRTPDGWRCQDALLVDEVVAQAPTLSAVIQQAAEALGVEL